MGKLGRIFLCIASVALWLAGSGCVTSELWHGRLVASTYEPSFPRNIALAEDPQGDVLVQYDELSPWNDRVTRRAYFLAENNDLINAGKAPHFATAEQTNHVTLIPIFLEPDAPTNAVPALGTIAVMRTNAMTFVILRPDKLPEGPYELPVYRTSDGTLKIALLTPVTVALDATVVGGAAAYFALGLLGGYSIPIKCWK